MKPLTRFILLLSLLTAAIPPPPQKPTYFPVRNDLRESINLVE